MDSGQVMTKLLRAFNTGSARSALLLAVLSLALGGCATFSPDGGLSAVQTLANDRVGVRSKLPAKGDDGVSAAAAIREMVGKPLDVDDAVQVALLNSPALRASLGELDIAEADLVQAGRLVNPRFSYSNRRSSDAATIDRTVMVNVMTLLTMPLAQKVAARQFESAQLQVASNVLQLAYETRRAYFAAVAAQQSQRYFEQVMTAAEASADLRKNGCGR